jgi:hypothetical protein
MKPLFYLALIFSIGSLVYGVISLTHPFRLPFVSFVYLWFLLLSARFFTEKLYPRVQFLHKTQESLSILIEMTISPKSESYSNFSLLKTGIHIAPLQRFSVI